MATGGLIETRLRTPDTRRDARRYLLVVDGGSSFVVDLPS